MKNFYFVTRRLVILLFGLPAFSLKPTLAQADASRFHEPFANVSQQAGIAATHRGEWDQFNPHFSSGYLGIGQAWGDYDNDGWLDLYVTGNMADNVLYNQQGKGFVDVTAKAGILHTGKGSSATWGDYNGDGYLDLYVGNWSCYPECGEPGPAQNTLAQDVLYRNNGDGTFTDVSNLLVYDKLLGSAFAVSFVDYDSDGDVDIYVANDMLKNPIGNVLWRNDGAGCGGWCWTDASAESHADTRTYAMGLAIGDYDNDLDPDFYFTNIVNHMTLLQNQGDGTFADATKSSRAGIGPTPAVGWGAAFFDYDNDGWLDLYVTTTQFIEAKGRGPGGTYLPPVALLAPYPDYLFRNNGDGSFRDTTPRRWLSDARSTMGLAYADYDNDGWVDYVVGEWNQGYALYRNTGIQSEDNHWLTLRLAGAGAVNRDAVGARVYVTSDDGRTQMQDVICGSSLGAGNDLALHFGLGSAAIRQIRIVWPDKTETLLKNIATNQILRVTYPDLVQTSMAKELH